MGSALAATCGDPAGIGPDVIAAWLSAAKPGESDGLTVIGPSRWLATLPSSVAKLPVGAGEYEAVPGSPDGESSLVAWAALETAARGCLEGRFAGVVTGPVGKERLAAIGWPHPGQTEFFAQRWGGEPTMAFCGGRLRVVLLTWHVPLRTVGAYLTAANFARAVAAASGLSASLGDARTARIGVCGLNPHAGEGGLLGTEERDVIDPILDGLRARFPGLSRTLPADTLFARQLRGEFDVILALYHDQGLAPLKTVEFDEAVNVTLGLPFVRTSPDHGTAYSLAGTGRANPRSFGQAVAIARRLLQSGQGRS
jgi:4-hydroxythreonine-4-phosphate dehydrogenase